MACIYMYLNLSYKYITRVLLKLLCSRANMYIITLNATSFFFADVTSLKGHKILWQDCQDTACPSVKFDGVPYINIGRMVKECHQGPDRQRRAKQRNRQKHVSVLWLLFYSLVLLHVHIYIIYLIGHNSLWKFLNCNAYMYV